MFKFLLTCVGVLVITVTAMVASYYLSALVMYSYYQWFIQPLTGWRDLTMINALGISSFISAVSYKINPADKTKELLEKYIYQVAPELKDDNEKQKLIANVLVGFTAIALPIYFLVFGYVVHLLSLR